MGHNRLARRTSQHSAWVVVKIIDIRERKVEETLQTGDNFRLVGALANRFSLRTQASVLSTFSERRFVKCCIEALGLRTALRSDRVGGTLRREGGRERATWL